MSQPSVELAGALEAIERLTDALTDERRQLMAAAEDRRAAEREREEARIQARRLEAELAAYRQAAAERAQETTANRDALRAQPEEIASANPIRALRLRRRLRTRLDGEAADRTRAPDQPVVRHLDLHVLA